jgi:ATP-dependent Clp protease ATP-binding subunit ClpA
MPDYYTASSQLLGSGRGIVMSYQSGRLEQVARHHAGALLEVSDLDHAPANVRSVLADLFLQVLETGEAQSATGAMFSCANVIFAFTMNLPGGMDESVRKGIGFGGPPTKREVSSRVVSEIKSMLSSAFVSRIGTPILFEPLDGYSLALILERAVKRAIFSAAERLHVAIMGVELAAGLGARLIASLESGLASWGARALLEHGRSLAAKAFVELHQRNSAIEGKILHASANDAGILSINSG